MAQERSKRFHVSPDGNSVMRSGGLLPAPEGWREITAEEYRAYRADERASSGEVPVRFLADVRNT